MSDHLTFMMGEFEAHFPTDRCYAKNHMWGLNTSDSTRFGFSAYAVRLLQDVYFLDWTVDPPANLEEGAEIGSIESKKAESSLYSPVKGKLTNFNAVLMDDPSSINVDKYGDGWLFEMECSSGELLQPQQYVEHLESVWEKTQKMIKGQINQ